MALRFIFEKIMSSKDTINYTF